MSEDKGFIKLPPTLVSPTDLSKVIREIDSIDNFMRQAKLRTSGTNVTPPKASKALEDVAEYNDISLLEEDQRYTLKQTLQIMLQKPVKVHMSFASSPSASFLQQMAEWFRKNVHQATLVEVGLQPTIAAGCVVRTRNKVFDLSLRNRFEESRDKLASSLSKPRQSEQPSQQSQEGENVGQ